MKPFMQTQRWKLFYLYPLLLSVCLVSAGCISRRNAWTSQGSNKFAIQASNPEQYFIRVPHNDDYPVPHNGRVTVSYSQANKYWEVKCADLIILGGHPSSNVNALYVMRGKKIVKKIALTPLKDFLSKYDTDDQGYLTLKLDEE